MVICILDNILNENKHKKASEVGEKVTKKISLKCFRELGASSRLVSRNEKLSVTLNILIHKKFCCLKSLLNLKNVLTRKGTKKLFPALWKLSNIVG